MCSANAIRSLRWLIVSAVALYAMLWARPLPQAVLTCAAQAQNPPNLSERAYQDREILYELQSPESHAFRITHDYTVRKVGERYYVNVLRPRSHVADPEQIALDRGAKLTCQNISTQHERQRQLHNSEADKDET